MKYVSKRFYLLLMCLLSALLVFWFISITKASTIRTIFTNWIDDDWHRVSLYSLFLKNDWNINDTPSLSIATGGNNLDVWTWLFIGTEFQDTNLSGSLNAIGWGSGNEIRNSNYGWICWWWDNTIDWGSHGSFVGWGSWNVAGSQNSVVWWWRYNVIEGWINSFIIWLNNNIDGNNAVILGWINNWGNGNSLVLWSWAWWRLYSFSWNAEVQEKAARINAKNWVLIWTYSPISWVSLVVSWAVKLGEVKSVTWSIWLNTDNKLQAYDGNAPHILGWGDEWGCAFGNVYIQNWESVTGYENYYSSSECVGVSITCSDWSLYPNDRTYYPYCYKLSE